MAGRVKRIAFLVFLLASCADPDREATDAENQLKMIQAAGGDNSEVCRAHERVAVAWLRRGNRERYETAKLYRDIACAAAELNPSGAR